MESFGNFYVNTSRFMFLSITGRFSSSGPIAKGWLKAFEVMPEVMRKGLLVRLHYFTPPEFSDSSSIVFLHLRVSLSEAGRFDLKPCASPSNAKPSNSS